MATIAQDPPDTTSNETVVYIPSWNVQAVIISLDEDLANLQNLERMGDYVKFEKVFDILLDVRNKLNGLSE